MVLLVHRKAELLLQPVQAASERLLVLAAHAFAVAVVIPVALRQLGELAREFPELAEIGRASCWERVL